MGVAADRVAFDRSFQVCLAMVEVSPTLFYCLHGARHRSRRPNVRVLLGLWNRFLFTVTRCYDE